MVMKLMTGMAAAAIAIMLVPAAPAEANHRSGFRVLPLFGTYYYPGRRYRRIPRNYYYQPRRFRDYEFEEGYYDPDYVNPERRKKAQKKKRTATKSTAVKKKPVVASTKPEDETASISPKTASGKAITCGKAQEIISGYGFDSVKASDCDGQLFAFTASRAGKPYTIKLSSVSGELTEVKKTQ